MKAFQEQLQELSKFQEQYLLRQNPSSYKKYSLGNHLAPFRGAEGFSQTVPSAVLLEDLQKKGYVGLEPPSTSVPASVRHVNKHVKFNIPSEAGQSKSIYRSIDCIKVGDVSNVIENQENVQLRIMLTT